MLPVAKNWIQLRVDIDRDFKIVAMVEFLMNLHGITEGQPTSIPFVTSVTEIVTAVTVDRLARIWGHAQKSIDSDDVVPFMTITQLDQVAGIPSFGLAMRQVGWLVELDKGLQFPNFCKNNTPERMRPKTPAERARDYRDRKKGADDGVTKRHETSRDRHATVTKRHAPDESESESEKASLSHTEEDGSASHVHAQSPRVMLKTCEAFCKAIEPLFGRNGTGRETSGPQYDADQTCADDWWEVRIWPPGTTDDEGLARYRQVLKWIRTASTKPGRPMAWLTTTMNERMPVDG